MAGLRIPQPETVAEAKLVRERLKKKHKLLPLKKDPKLIAAADAAFLNGKVIAVACLFTYPGLELLDEQIEIMPVTFPYVPGYLSFREGPAIIMAVRKLKQRPELLILDGQGTAHPEAFGLACQVGVLLDMPTIGCAKSRLVGDYEEPGPDKGSQSPLSYKGKIIGATVRTRQNTRILFVSPGHRTTIKDAVRITLGCARGFRVIEPVRYADMRTKQIKRLSGFKPVFCKKS